MKSKLNSVTVTEAEVQGSYTAQKGRWRRHSLLRTLMPGQSTPLVERQQTNMTQDDQTGTSCLKSGTGQTEAGPRL